MSAFFSSDLLVGSRADLCSWVKGQKTCPSWFSRIDDGEGRRALDLRPLDPLKVHESSAQEFREWPNSAS